MVEKYKMEIRADLFEKLRLRAREQGRPEGDLLDEAFRRYLGEGGVGIGELLEGAERWQREHGIEPLSDEESMRLADDELHAMRRERREPPRR